MAELEAKAPGRRICVVGSGIAGLSAAYHLAKHGGDAVKVTLFESEAEIGGHEKPVQTKYGTVDLGYMVLNKFTYPNLLRFYEEHNVPLEATDMGFAVDNPAVSWCFTSNTAQQLRLLLHPQLPSFVRDKSRFHADALAFLERYSTDEDEGDLADSGTERKPAPPAMPLRAFCDQRGYGSAFIRGWLEPFCEAVWSAPKSEALAMDAYTILAFLRNHGFLTWSTPQWLTPHGRTTRTLDLFRRLFVELGVEVHTGNPVHRVSRKAQSGSVVVESERLGKRTFDDVVLATPSGTALKLINNPTPEDEAALSGFAATHTRIILHTNPALMPKNKALWSSWNVIERGDTGDHPLLMYWVKPLQHVSEDHLFITLNPPATVTEEKGKRDDVLLEWETQHPVMSVAALRSQRRVARKHQGKGGVWYAGAYMHYGFHEDGFRSGIEVARALLNNDSIPLLPISADAFHSQHRVLSGTTTHVRFNPETKAVLHSFHYPLEYHYINVDAGFATWWGGLCRRDYFGDPQESLGTAVRRKVREETGVWPSGCIDTITVPRHYGYCFNPISLFLCWDSAQRKRVDFLVSQVTNTPWGEYTVQVLDLRPAASGHNTAKVNGLTPEGTVWHVIDKPKTLHVSPFNPIPDGDATWRYTLRNPTREMAHFELRVELFEDRACTRRKLMANMVLKQKRGPEEEWKVRLLPPLPRPLLVQWWIHVQAAVLFLRKRQQFHPNTAASYITHPPMLDLVRVLRLLWLPLFLIALPILAIALFA